MYTIVKKIFPKRSKNAAYIRFLAHELAPYIDENYPTYQMGKGRVLIEILLAEQFPL